MDREPFVEKGYIIADPEDVSRGYKITRGVYSGEVMRATDFEAFGGAEEPKTGDPIPPYVALHNWGGRTDAA